MNKLKLFFQNLVFTESSAPFAFFVLCFLSFGLLIPNLGFYMDDWHYVFYAKLKGIDSLQEMLLYDSRPGATWLYILAFNFLGFNVFYWHIFNFMLILITVIMYWLLIRMFWKEV